MINKILQPFLAAEEEITRQLDRMLGSPNFTATPQQIALLNYVVDQSLAGKADRIKGYTVATEVFGRGSDFDQSIDPIVSIQASRLRQALAKYYEGSGKNDPIRIEIPIGTYVPIFMKQLPGDQHVAAENVESVSVMTAWPTIRIQPLTDLTANPEDTNLANGLTAELAHALSHYPEIQLLETLHQDQKWPPPEMDVDFIIDGNVRRDSESVKVAIGLCDAKKCIRIWSGVYQGDFESVKMISFQEAVAEEVAVRVAGGNAVIAKHFADLHKDKVPPNLRTYAAVLRYWESAALRTPQKMSRAIQALEHAVDREPNYGQVWSMLAAQYANNYGLELVDLRTPLEKAAEFARRGVSLEPANRRTRMILAYVRFMENKLTEAGHEAEVAYQLCPQSLLVLDTLGWLTALAGEWEKGVNWIEKAIRFNPYCHPWVRHALCINWFRKGDYEKAYRESLRFIVPELFWDPLLKAAACGHLGKIEEGQACVRALLKRKPDFAQRGPMLIGRYVKFEDIADRIIEGLNAVGIVVS